MSSWNVLRGPIKIAIVDLPAKRTLRRGVTLLMNRERMLAGILSLFFSRKPLALYCTWTRREVGVTHITTCILFAVAKPINRLIYCLFVCSFCAKLFYLSSVMHNSEERAMAPDHLKVGIGFELAVQLVYKVSICGLQEGKITQLRL